MDADDKSQSPKSPLLAAAASTEERGRESMSYEGTGITPRPPLHRMRSRSPGSLARISNSRRWIYAAIALVISLFSFVVQTENAAYIQRDLGWKKPYMMLYLTHGSWWLLFPLQLLFIRIRKRNVSTKTLFRLHINSIRATARLIATDGGKQPQRSVLGYFLRSLALITGALTLAGSTWYVAINMTTPSDLTAIYNSNAFFAYAFSIPLLREPLRQDKMWSVLIAIVGVVIIAYGDSRGSDQNNDIDLGVRFAGNIIIGIGSVMYGLYEVMYKKLACPPDDISAGRKVVFANTICASIGALTVLVMWFPLPILHVTGIESFVFPTGEVGNMMWISVLSNMTFSGSFLILISLTSPVLSAVAALLTIFLVALVDWFWTGEPLSAAAIIGGLLIMAAFAVLSWATWRELNEEVEKAYIDTESDED